MNYKHLQILLRQCNTLEFLKQIHAQAVTLGILHHHQPFACKLLNSYAKLGTSQEPNALFSQIQNPDIVSWTCLINLHVQVREPRKALWVFSRLICRNIEPDSYSVVAALSACKCIKDLACGRIVHGIIVQFSLGFDPIVGNALIDMYSKNKDIESTEKVFKCMECKDIASWNSLLNGFAMVNDLESSRLVFDEMPQRNSVSWNAMITAYVRGREIVEALELFREMKAGGECCTVITIVAVLSGCADIGALDLGKCIHGYVSKSNLGFGVTVNNALMDMYAKSGCLDMALKVISEIREKDVFSWTTLISGYAFHGKGKNALEVFGDMIELKMKPHEVTFLSVLSACSHAGLLVEGQRLFNRMNKFYGLQPKIEHYGCMVDLLGRAGLLEEAKDFIEQMPINPDAVIWRSLLRACLVHGNLNLAEMAAKMLIELEPDDDGVYILLWNIYFAANRQEDALKMRTFMQNQKVKKKSGCSWVEVNGVTHEFKADYVMHHAGTEIFLVLEGINEQTKLDGQFFVLE
ncbi:pentatricopeptide repeat-containing protein At2g29760, chloroplastic-like [Pistacia vera]|uniref:pentatricopeptide repeat-containing protein At2g29760, chloroplastic-like n=1 Tax=Pistacia vera TaxID=55513 RepID=UPI001263ACEA|nr:pentatricopeptide repeat-containing protein At2g29760, chloroplastic-like [Pistacia vera]